MSNDDFGSNVFIHTTSTETWQQVGGMRSWTPFKKETKPAFEARMQIYSARLRRLLVAAGMIFVQIRAELKFAHGKYTVGILTINHDPEAVHFSTVPLPDMDELLRQVDEQELQAA